jgi:hypothetical protein
MSRVTVYKTFLAKIQGKENMKYAINTATELKAVHIVYRMSQEECARLREGVPYVKIYQYNPKHLCPKLNGYGDNCQRSLKS